MKILKSLEHGKLLPFAPLALRLPVGFHLIHGTQDNVFSWARMIEFSHFLAAQGFPIPLACAVVSVAAQFTCGFLYLAGWMTRWAAMVMVFNFTVALTVHIGDPYGVAFPAIFMWFSSLALVFSGAGAFSVDATLARRRHTVG